MTEIHGLQSLKYLHSGPLQTKITDSCTKCPGPGLAVEAAIAEMFFRCGKRNSQGEVNGDV